LLEGKGFLYKWFVEELIAFIVFSETMACFSVILHCNSSLLMANAYLEKTLHICKLQPSSLCSQDIEVRSTSFFVADQLVVLF